MASSAKVDRAVLPDELSAPPQHSSHRGVLTGAVIGAVGLVARLAIVLVGGGFDGNTGYDPGVYYAAADALVFGRLPYRDFTLIHPPVSTLLLAPIAEIGRLTTDHVGFMLAMLAAMVAGAINAALVYSIALRLDLGRRAAMVGGLFYAVFYPCAGAEWDPRLEPFGNFFVLLGLLMFVRGARRRSAVNAFFTGAFLALAVSDKIWFAVPMIVVLVWTVVERRGGRQLSLTVAGALGAAVLVDGPFFVLAPRAMFQAVVIDQLGRVRMKASTPHRLDSIAGLSVLHLPGSASGAALVLATVVAVVLLVLAWRHRAGRLPVVLFVAELGTLVASPSYFDWYADFAATGAALVLAAAAARAPAPRRTGRFRGLSPGLLAGTVLLAAAASTGYVDLARPAHLLPAYPAKALRPVLNGARCVQSDEPVNLIELNVLSRDLGSGCRQWVDVTGRTYGVDRRVERSGRTYPRARNPAWQRDLRSYLRSGDAVILTRPGTGLSARTRRLVTAGRLLGSTGGVKIYAVNHP